MTRKEWSDSGSLGATGCQKHHQATTRATARRVTTLEFYALSSPAITAGSCFRTSIWSPVL
jgi:hypothetical protein